jgi:hypothetical protein
MGRGRQADEEVDVSTTAATLATTGASAPVMGLQEATGWPTGLVVLAVALAVLQIGLLVAALVDLLRRPDEAVTGGRRWVWILVVVLVQTIGPLVYFAAGRRPRPAADPRDQTGAAHDPVRRTVDLLYGAPEGSPALDDDVNDERRHDAGRPG